MAKMDVPFGRSATDSSFVKTQLQDTRSGLPVLVFFHFFATYAVWQLLHNSVPDPLMATWIVGSLAAGASFPALHALNGRISPEKQEQALLVASPFIGLALGSVWAFMLIVLCSYGDFEQTEVLDVLTMSILVVGLVSVLRLPGTAFLFSFMVISAATYRAGNFAFSLSQSSTLVGIACLSALGLLLVFLNRSFRRRHILELASKRDGEVIRLLLNDLGEELRDWLWETDAEGKLIYFSPRLTRLMDATAFAMTGSPFIQNFFGKYAPHLLPELAHHKLLVAEKLTTRTHEKEEHWLMSAKPMQDENGAFIGYRGVARDVTQQWQQDQVIAHARDEAEKANAAKSQFLAVMSHELRTPINAIVGFSEVLNGVQGDHLPSAARREYIGTVLESARHLQGLINDVLEATRMERGAISLDDQPSDAAELIEVAVKIVRDQASKAKISLVARVIEDVEVMGDITRLKQVLLNLLTNAIKFSPEGGIVQLEMLRGLGGGLLITIRDAGIGISREDAERVFEPFVQLENGSNRRFGGMGLGLAIARRVARLHGGDLSLEGELGVGTEARFTLPPNRVHWPKPATKPKAQPHGAAA